MALTVQPLDLTVPDPALQVVIDTVNKLLRASQLDATNAKTALAVGGTLGARVIELNPNYPEPPMPATTTEV